MSNKKNNNDLILAVEEFSQGWFPANPDILKEIRQKIRNKCYKTTKELLLDIRRDSALFTYLLRNALPKRKESSLDVLLAKKLEDLEKSMPGVVSQISKFELPKILELQARNLQLMIISSVSAQILAINSAVDPDLAYITSVLRTMGLAMTAWNYQHTYAKVLKQVDCDYTDLDFELNNKLGFSPTEAALNLAKAWKLPPEVYRAAYRNSSFRSDDTLLKLLDPQFEEGNKELTNKLIKICKIAEGLAVSTVTSGTSAADYLWKTASTEAIEVIGPDAIKQIEQTVNTLWASYAPLFSGWYDEIFNESGTIGRVVSDFGKKYFTQNTSILQCSTEIQQVFVEIYKKMTNVNTAARAFNMLVCDLIPAAGFMEGGIYIADRSTMHVAPLMMLGRAGRNDFKPAYMYNRNMEIDPLTKSLMSGTIVKGRVAVENREVLYISSAVGLPPNQLVVYLETSHRPFLNGEQDATSCFRAVQQCLVDSIMHT